MVRLHFYISTFFSFVLGLPHSLYFIIPVALHAAQGCLPVPIQLMHWTKKASNPEPLQLKHFCRPVPLQKAQTIPSEVLGEGDDGAEVVVVEVEGVDSGLPPPM